MDACRQSDVYHDPTIPLPVMVVVFGHGLGVEVIKKTTGSVQIVAPGVSETLRMPQCTLL